MTIKYKYIFFILISINFYECVPPKEEVLTEISRNLRDSTLQLIINYQDQNLTDSLITFFYHKDPSYRYAAAMAFGSTKEKSAIDSLVMLLKDPIPEVRMAAAYAIGQIGDAQGENALIEAFAQYDSTGRYRKANGAILEAVGKCASPSFLKSLGTISTYQPKDTVLLEGQAWGIYRYALRNIIAPEGTSKMLEFVNNPKFPFSVRMIAANYLGRAKGIDINANLQALSATLAAENDPKIKIPLVLGIGKIQSPEAGPVLLNQFQKEQDYRVKVNIIRALKNFDYEVARITILDALEDNNLPIAETAAEYFISNGMPQDATIYWQKAKEELPWQVQLKLYEAANKHLPNRYANYKGAINAELRRRIASAGNAYERASTFRALGDFGWNYQFLQRQVSLVQTAIEKTAIVEALAKIAQNPNFNTVFGISRNRVSRELSKAFLQAIKSQDVGSMSVAAGALRNENIDFRVLLQDSLNVILEAQQLLPLPKAVEAYNEIQKTIDFFSGKTSQEPMTPKHNHPIDWAILSKVSTNVRASIQTSKGQINISLFPLLAPGTVANFIQLAVGDFFNGKVFHRVVPNFVIQGGCPRGDGYGSLDYSIRSELPLAHYDDEGYVGMASAGNHTEGTQFFVTHSPTPHLDGNYTIFAKVASGMEVVHQIEVGDTIKQITINY